MSGLGPLADGGRVAIIGGGPGGIGCALALHRLSGELGRRLSITLFEGKQFMDGRHHNLCVGIVSPPLPELLERDLGVPFPSSLRLGAVNGYVLHTVAEQIALDDETHPSVALRRVDFDAYMLDTAQRCGIRVVPARATELEFHADCVTIYSEGMSVEADVVIGGFGLDAGAAEPFRDTVGYEPPEAMVSLLTRYYPGPEAMAAFGPRVHAFLTGQPGVEFGAISPKGDHLTINIAGMNVGTGDMRTFLASPAVRALLPGAAAQGGTVRSGTDIRSRPIYKGRFPCSLARRYFGDRYALVGDAAGLVRAFKGKGVTSAVQTGIRAAETILRDGISAQAFAGSYVAANRDIIGDLPYGRVVRLVVLVSARLRLIDPVVRAARRDADVRGALYGAVSAHDSYRSVFLHMLRPGALAAVVRAMVRA